MSSVNISIKQLVKLVENNIQLFVVIVIFRCVIFTWEIISLNERYQWIDEFERKNQRKLSFVRK